METATTGLEKYANWVKEGKNPQAKQFHSKHKTPHHTSSKTIRSMVYRDKPIEIETTYKVKIDGKPLGAHVEVLNNGTVHCHTLPNYAFYSAIDLAKTLIDRSYKIRDQVDELGGYKKAKKKPAKKRVKKRKAAKKRRSKKASRK